MRLETAQYEYIKQTVTDTYLEYGVKCIPISAFELAVKMGIRLQPYSALSKREKEAAKAFSMDGFSVERVSGEWIIFYNDEDNNYERMNRTIMHEIGHFALGHTGEAGEEEEMEANFFAKYAIAPPVLIDKFRNENSYLELLIRIYENFRVTKTAGYNCFKYYLQWRAYFNNVNREYKDYEKMIINQFN